MNRCALACGMAVLVVSLGCRSETAPTAATHAAPLAAAGKSALVPVPEPDLAGAESAAREQLQDLRAAVDAAAAADDTEALASAYGDLGSAYIVYELITVGSAALENARHLAPDDFRWHYMAAYADQLQGRLDSAAAGYERTLAIEGYPPARLRLARVRLDQGDLEQAEAGYRAALNAAANDKSDRAAALEGLGRIADARGDLETAARNLEAARGLAPEATSLNYALGQIYRKLGDIERARALLADRGDVPVRIPDPLISALGTLGRTAQLYVMQAAEAMDDGNFEAAAAAYQRALAADETSFTAYRGLATAVERLGDLEGAINHLRHGLERGRSADPEAQDRDRAELARMLGSMLVVAGRDNDAIDSFRRASSLDPERDDTLLLLSNALAREGSFAAAIDALDAMGEETAPALLLKRATLLVNLGRRREAIETFERLVAARPDDPTPHLRFAEALAFLGDDARAAAERIAGERLAAAGENATISDGGPDPAVDLLIENARSRLASGDFESAVGHFDQAIAKAPGLTGVRLELAQLLGHLGYFDDALREFRTVVDEAPRNAGARRGEITVLLLVGRFGMARVRLQDALKAFPLDAGLAHVQARLLASSPDPDVRDGALALQLVGQLMKVRADASVRETHAMALAAAGQFGDAASVMRALVTEAERDGQMAAVTTLRARLERFEAGEVWAARSGEEIVAATFGRAAQRGASG